MSEHVNTKYRVFCKKCGEEMEIPDGISTVVEKGIVEKILEETCFAIGIYKCKCGARVFVLSNKEDYE